MSLTDRILLMSQILDDATVSAGPEPNVMTRLLRGYRRIIVFTQGYAGSGFAKTATSLLRYRQQDVVAVLDSSVAGLRCQDIFGTGDTMSLCASLDEIAEADALFIGIAPAGGRLPEEWRSTIANCLRRGIDVVSGLHDFLSDDPELEELARRHGARILDLRKNRHTSVASGAAFPHSCLRIHTVGQDCSVGKMVTAIEIERELKRRGYDSRFVATGQTGIMIDGAGVPVDAVVADFISGAVESQVVAEQQHDFVLIEGQGSLSHPSFSGVTLGLLHGCAPQGLVLCYAPARKSVLGLPDKPLTPLARLVELYESSASVRFPAKVIGVAVNGSGLSNAEVTEECLRVSEELRLPACDVYRDGAGKLVDAILRYREEIQA